jgi:hypothetical protein
LILLLIQVIGKYCGRKFGFYDLFYGIELEDYKFLSYSRRNFGCLDVLLDIFRDSTAEWLYINPNFRIHF